MATPVWNKNAETNVIVVMRTHHPTVNQLLPLRDPDAPYAPPQRPNRLGVLAVRLRRRPARAGG
jgi:hypothetical protein